MTNAPAPVMNPVKPVEEMTIDERKARIEADKADAIAKYIAAQEKKAEREVEKLEGDAQENAMKEKGIEFAQAVRANAEDVLNALGIVVPAKGLKFSLSILHAESGDGLTISFENANKPRAASTSTGTRAPRGTGTGAGVSISKIDGFSGFILPDGTEAKSASQACQALGFDFGSGSAAAFIVRASLKDVEKANAVKIVINGVQQPLGDAVVEHFGKPAEAVATA